MRIRVDEEAGVIEIDGVKISAHILKEMVEPRKRVLFKFVKRPDGMISAIAYSEANVIWMDEEGDVIEALGITDGMEAD